MTDAKETDKVVAELAAKGTVVHEDKEVKVTVAANEKETETGKDSKVVDVVKKAMDSPKKEVEKAEQKGIQIQPGNTDYLTVKLLEVINNNLLANTRQLEKLNSYFEDVKKEG